MKLPYYFPEWLYYFILPLVMGITKIQYLHLLASSWYRFLSFLKDQKLLTTFHLFLLNLFINSIFYIGVCTHTHTHTQIYVQNMTTGQTSVCTLPNLKTRALPYPISLLCLPHHESNHILTVYTSSLGGKL